MPGDKSLSHRAVLFSAMAEGVSLVSGVLDSADVRSTIAAVRGAGRARVARAAADGSLRGTHPRVGRGGPAAPRAPDRLRQQRHHRAAADGRPRRLAGRGRRSSATSRCRAADAPRHRAARVDGRSVRVPRRRHAARGLAGARALPTAGDAACSADRLRVAGRLGAGQDGGAARGPARRTGAPRSPSPRRAATTPSGCFPRSACRSRPTRARVEASVDGPVHALRPPTSPSRRTLPRRRSSSLPPRSLPGSEVRVADVALNPTRTGFVRVLERMGARVNVRGRVRRAGASRSGRCSCRYEPALARVRRAAVGDRVARRRGPGARARRRRRPAGSRASRASASCASRSRTGSPRSSTGLRTLGAVAWVEGDDSRGLGAVRRCTAARSTRSATTGSR